MKIIEKNSREVIVVQESEYKDSKFVDIRVHGKNDNDDLIPTKKGVALNPKFVPQLIEALLELGEEKEWENLYNDKK